MQTDQISQPRDLLTKAAISAVEMKNEELMVIPLLNVQALTLNLAHDGEPRDTIMINTLNHSLLLCLLLQ